MDDLIGKVAEDIDALRGMMKQNNFGREEMDRLKGYDKLWKGYNLLIRIEQNRIFAERNAIVMERFKAMYPKYFGKKESKEIELK